MNPIRKFIQYILNRKETKVRENNEDFSMLLMLITQNLHIGKNIIDYWMKTPQNALKITIRFVFDLGFQCTII